jgi:hypothetical protein
MKRVLIPFFSCLLVFTLLLGSFGSAKAEVGDDPVVTPVSGDMEFTTEVVPIASLPGTVVLASQMLAPVGFPEGEAQFEGAGMRVTSMDSGKATACFTLSTIAVNQGWGGKIGVWNEVKWVLLPTTITTTTDEAAATTACATIYGNGTYAFIKYIVDATLLPKTIPIVYSECPFTAKFMLWGGATIDSLLLEAAELEAGIPVTLYWLSSDPPGFFSFVGTGRGLTVLEYGNVYRVRLEDWLLYTMTQPVSDFKIYVTYGNCYMILDYPEDNLVYHYPG